MDDLTTRALDLLRLGTGLPGVGFREGQEEAIRRLVEGRGRLLVVQRTGWGKSAVYFIAARLLRERGEGPTLLVSPLLALMRNQLRAAERMGVRAATIHSDNPGDWAQVEIAMRAGELDLLLVSPERLANGRFRREVLAPVAGRVAMLVVDEAHCVSDWGHDFRPHYRLIERIVRQLPRGHRLLATTATANNRVMADLREVLGPELAVLRGELHRPSLALQTIALPSQAQRLAWLAERLPELPGSGIVYTLTVRDARRVAAWLADCGVEVAAYSSESEDREALEDALLANRFKALVATTALGMGFDKPDLGFVVHFQAPGSAVAYYQQVGRAGRSLPAAYGVLLHGAEDAAITDWFIDSAFPTREEVRQVLAAIESEPEGRSVPELLGALNISKPRVEKTLDLLSLESPAPVVKEGTRWQLAAAELSPAFWERAERLTALRRAEQAQMLEYTRLRTGHMAFLIRALDGDPAGAAPPPLPPLPETAGAGAVRAAEEFLKRTNHELEPRRMWPPGGLPREGLRGRIPAEGQAAPGRALCAWGDAGWGELVRRGKYAEGRYADELVEALAGLVDRWSPRPAPVWVTAVPSLRRPELVPDLARRLAARLGLAYCDALRQTHERPEQKTMANAVQQARNIDGTLELLAGPRPAGAVLLVDDMADSRWTLTLAAWRLRTGGCPAVHPLVLALTG
jgi:ATP-dependent DNA helicase RecQ